MQRSYAGLKPTLSHTPPSVIGLATVLPLIILFLDETIRHHDRKKVPAYQPSSLALITVYHAGICRGDSKRCECMCFCQRARALRYAWDLICWLHQVRRLQQRLTLEFETLLGQTSPK